MRDFEERKTEIFRRSKERLAQRRRRRRIIISCIPLVICLIALSFVDVPKLMPEKDKSDNYSVSGTMASAPSETQESKKYSSVKIQGKIQDNDYCKVIEEPESVEQIACVIEKYHVEEESTVLDEAATDCTALEGDSSIKEQAPNENVKEDDYVMTITVTFSDGSERIYSIIGDRLSDLTSGGNVFLSDSQLSEISSLLADSK